MKIDISKLKPIQTFIIKHAPEILTGIAVAGIPIGDYFIIKGVKNDNKNQKILGGVIHGGSIISIVASNRLSNTQKVSLVAAGVASATQLKDYRQITKTVVEPDAFEKIEKIFTEDELEGLMIDADEADELIDAEKRESVVYYFPQLHKIFQCSPDKLNVALLNLNQTYAMYGRASLHDFIRWIDPNDISSESYEFGWLTFDEDPEAGYTSITVNQYTKPTRRGVDVTYIWFMDGPMKFEEWENYYDRLFRDYEEEVKEGNGTRWEVPLHSDKYKGDVQIVD